METRATRSQSASSASTSSSAISSRQQQQYDELDRLLARLDTSPLSRTRDAKLNRDGVTGRISSPVEGRRHASASTSSSAAPQADATRMSEPRAPSPARSDTSSASASSFSHARRLSAKIARSLGSSRQHSGSSSSRFASTSPREPRDPRTEQPEQPGRDKRFGRYYEQSDELGFDDLHLIAADAAAAEAAVAAAADEDDVSVASTSSLHITPSATTHDERHLAHVRQRAQAHAQQRQRQRELRQRLHGPTPEDDDGSSVGSSSISIVSRKSSRASLANVDRGSPSLASVTSAPQMGTTQSAPGGSVNARPARAATQVQRKHLDACEWTQTCWLWERGPSTTSSGHQRATLMRDVPAVMRKRMGHSKRHSSSSPYQLLAPSASTQFDLDELAKPSRASKEKRLPPPAPLIAKEGRWRKVTSVMRDSGHLRIYGEDKTMVTGLNLRLMRRTDVRFVDSSVLGRPNCIAVYRHDHDPDPPTSPNLSQSSKRSEAIREPLMLWMPTFVAAQTWLVVARCLAQPEIYPPLASAASSSESDEDAEDVARCRVWRSLTVTVSEARRLGEPTTLDESPMSSSPSFAPSPSFAGGLASLLGASTTARAPKSSLDSAAGESTTSRPSLRTQESISSDLSSKGESASSLECFCEISVDGIVHARTTVQRGTTSPFWRETFTFSDMPPLHGTLGLTVYHVHKGQRAGLLGSATTQIAPHAAESWLALRSPSGASVGHVCVAMSLGELAVLPRREYSPLEQLLTMEDDGTMTIELSQRFPTDLDELAQILTRVYLGEGVLLQRICHFVAAEVDRHTETASVLFRGNTLLTKTLELYMRLVGADFLEACVGEPVRRLCVEKPELEIDPLKLKSRDQNQHVAELREWVDALWRSIYEARYRCPQELRHIFKYIQKTVQGRFGDDRTMRATSVSAFIFLRFFVPAILNPMLFGLVSTPSDARVKRSLTLVAKTLQGLANFTSFGSKEPWMAVMNPFLQANTEAFVDLINHLSTPSDDQSADWTSPASSQYLTAYRMRNSMPPLMRDGVPLLPHLLDLGRDCAQLASLVAQCAPRRKEEDAGPVLAKFMQLCVDLDEEARRRLDSNEQDEQDDADGVLRIQRPNRMRVRTRSATARPTDHDEPEGARGRAMSEHSPLRGGRMSLPPASPLRDMPPMMPSREIVLLRSDTSATLGATIPHSDTSATLRAEAGDQLAPLDAGSLSRSASFSVTSADEKSHVGSLPRSATAHVLARGGSEDDDGSSLRSATTNGSGSIVTNESGRLRKKRPSLGAVSDAWTADDKSSEHGSGSGSASRTIGVRNFMARVGGGTRRK